MVFKVLSFFGLQITSLINRARENGKISNCFEDENMERPVVLA